MDFLSSIFIAIASFFGLQSAEVPVEPVATSSQETVFSTETGNESEQQQYGNSSSEPVVVMEATGNEPVADLVADTQTMIVAGGCFWCVESDLEKLTGVLSVVSGYSGGTTQNPTYENYGAGGHREVVKVTYDPGQISFADILIVTLKTTDPTDDTGTFGDRGDKYSAAFYYESPAEQQIITDLIAEVDEQGPYDAPLAIDVEERASFWPAEDYHQDYYKGALSQLKYKYYRNASGRDRFIDTYWGDDGYTTELPWRNTTSTNNQTYMWSNYQKPSQAELKQELDPLVYTVTQEDGTERAGTSPLDKIEEAGIYVDVLSGEPLYSSKDKFDSGTGWPSFVKPITPGAVTEHEDKKLFSVRTETRSAIADNHLGHVFNDGPADRGGLRYCMNGAALRFVPKTEMEEQGYGDFLQYI
jgi:peptide methionine sulfoxide reductase msrA/msrB